MRLSLVAAVMASLWLSLGSAAAEGRWWRAESAHFIVYSQSGENDLRRSVEELERFDATLRQLTQNNAAPSENKLEIYLVQQRAELDEVRPRIGSNVLGFYSANVEHIAAFALDRNRGMDARTVLFHEYAHHFMFQYFASAYPSWFAEGFAEYVSTADLTDRRSRLGGYDEGRTYPLFEFRWSELADILDPARENAGRIPAHMFYAQAWIYVHYILSSPERKRALSRYFTAVQSGADRVSGFEQAFGVPLSEWQSDVRAYMRRGIALHDLPPANADLSMQITRLPESADDLLLLMARARREVKDEEREELARLLIAAASRHPGDAYAQYALARAEFVRNQPAAARPILEGVLAANPNDLEAQYLLALSYFTEAEAAEDAARGQLMAQARTHFVRAFRIDGDHVPTLYHYARTFPMPLEDQTLEVLLRAQELAPQVETIGFYTAIGLMYGGAHAQAVPLLRSIAYNRHGDLQRHALITLEAALVGGDPPPAPPPEENAEED